MCVSLYTTGIIDSVCEKNYVCCDVVLDP